MFLVLISATGNDQFQRVNLNYLCLNDSDGRIYCIVNPFITNIEENNGLDDNQYNYMQIRALTAIGKHIS
jgi:hypothetical protein